ncbi:MAG: hypothetical protein ABFR36_02455 [Acidobacteriota bacterium]
MKFINLILIFTFLFAPIMGEDNKSAQFNEFSFDEFMFNSLPGSYFPGFFLENYAPDVTLMVEENNGFSHIDNPRVYFEGESFINFNWNYDGFNITSSLDPGRSAIIFPFSTYSGYSLKGSSSTVNDPGLYITSTDHKMNYSRGILSTVYSDLGSYTPLGPVMIQPEHPSLRAEMLYNTRRGINNTYFFDFLLNRNLSGGNISLGVNHYYIKRDFNDFNEFDEQFRENGNYLVFSLKYKKEIKHGSYELLAGVNSLKRDNEYAELGRLPQETVNNSLNSYFSGFKLEGNKFLFLISYIRESSQRSQVTPGYSFNIFDNDGDDIFPVNRFGTFSSDIFSSELRYNLIKNGYFDVEVFGSSRLSMHSSNETTANYNSIFAGNDPYQVILWEEGKAFKNSNFGLKTGVRFNWEVNKTFLLTGQAFWSMSGLSFDFGENNLSFSDFGFNLGFYNTGKSHSLYLSGGRAPGNLKENINYFLDKSGSSGTIHYWTDINNDDLYQAGEERGIYSYTGNKYHSVDQDFKNPVTNSLILLYSKKISRNYVFNLKALYKQFKNNPWVRFNEDYGHYQTLAGEELYFIDIPPENFYLSNYQFDKDPFYAQLLLNFTGRVSSKWFFSFSFMAHMGMGYTSFGNGPNSNDIGIINESMANPNTWINGFGRLDGDRGFVSKLYFGYFLSKKLFLGVSIKYRDGNPFAFLNREYNDNQWILYYKTIQAEDERGIKGGPREDYISDVSFKLSYKFKFFEKNASMGLSFFNVLDFGGEISEYVFSGGERYSLEMQIPKSIRLTLAFEL